MNKPFLIIISGPTASGKTSLSLKLAEQIEKTGKMVCIINFDSLLFYKELNIGTAKPSYAELNKFEHKLVNINSIAHPLNSFEYVSLAKEEINKAHGLGKVVILVGGSAFYLRALFTEMYDSKIATEEFKNKMEVLFKEKGIEGFLEILKNEDPESYKLLHKNDHYRVFRAVEYLRLTGHPISTVRNKTENPYLLKTNDFNFFHCYLNPPKDPHLKIIQDRTNKMLAEGLIEEVKGILESGFTGEERPLKAIGYQEVLAFLKGEIKTVDELSERIFISTRQLAKSQRTFFKKITPKNSYDPLNEFEKILIDIQIFLKKP